MLVRKLLHQCGTIRVKAIERLVQQPQRRALPDQAGKGGAFFLPRREITDRHVEQAAQPETGKLIVVRTVDAFPEGERRAQRVVRATAASTAAREASAAWPSSRTIATSTPISS